MSAEATASGARVSAAARAWHGATALVAGTSLVAQLTLAITGEADTAGTRVVHYFSYFTILSNIVICIVTAMLAKRPDRDGPAFRVARLLGVTCITVTGLVHYTLLRPLPEVQDLTGWAQVCDIGLHIVVPILAFVGWLAFGPRPRIAGRTVWVSALVPIAWLAYTLVRGEVTGWYPYPFVDAADLGYGRVLLNCAGVAALYLAFAGLALLTDRRLPPAPAEG